MRAVRMNRIQYSVWARAVLAGAFILFADAGLAQCSAGDDLAPVNGRILTMVGGKIVHAEAPFEK